jgi:hypothetical protein
MRNIHSAIGPRVGVERAIELAKRRRGDVKAQLTLMTAAICSYRNAWTPNGVIFWPLGLAEKGDTQPPASCAFRGEPLPYVREDNDEPIPPQDPGQPRAYTPVQFSCMRIVFAG